MRLYCFALCILTALFSCSSDSTQEQMEAEFYKNINVVTGLNFYDDNGNPVGRWKSPNNNPGDIKVYPNPSRGVFQISDTEGFSKLYLIPAQCMIDSTERNIALLSMSLSYLNEELESSSIVEFELDSNNHNFQLDFSSQSDGFYRLFFEHSDQSYSWENIYINAILDNQNYIQMIDTNGDGWNGNVFGVEQDNNEIITFG